MLRHFQDRWRMNMAEVLGTVTGLRGISPYEFWIRVNTQTLVPGLDDMIRVDYEWNRRIFRAYGVITEIVTQWDGTITTGYQEEAHVEGVFSGIPIYLGRVIVTRVLIQKGESMITITPFLPPPVGQMVVMVDRSESDIALGFDVIKREKREIPAGILSNDEVGYLDLKYLLGDNGAHINVSGQSGVAAKTSYATFLLWMIKNYGRRNLRNLVLANSRSIIFNVKGESLLFLDHWNQEWIKAKSGSEEDQRRYVLWQDMFQKFELDPHPFEQVEIGVAPRDAIGTPNISHFRSGVYSYGWDIIDVVELGLIPLMFDPEELSSNPNFQLAVSVIEDLLRDRYEALVADARKELSTGMYQLFHLTVAGLDNKSLLYSYLICSQVESEQILHQFGLPNGFDQLIDMLRLEPNFGEKEQANEAGDLAKALRREQISDTTILAISRRLRNAGRAGLNHLWRRIDLFASIVDQPPAVSYHLNWNRPGGVTVVDISKLHARTQTFVVGAVLRDIMYHKEKVFLTEPVFIYLDELNKYAPRSGGGPLGSIFRDVAERGRSFRVVLIGAEQTASQVDYRVITQAATSVVGRQKYAELVKEEYAHLQGTLREKAASLLPGEMILDQPFFRIPITVKFPLTPWATSEESRGEWYRTDGIPTVKTPGGSLEEDLKRLLE